MQSQIVAVLTPEGAPEAALLVRRSSGQFAIERIDARVASAARVAAGWYGSGVPLDEEPSGQELAELELV